MSSAAIVIGALIINQNDKISVGNAFPRFNLVSMDSLAEIISGINFIFLRFVKV